MNKYPKVNYEEITNWTTEELLSLLEEQDFRAYTTTALHRFLDGLERGVLANINAELAGRTSDTDRWKR